jgi:hypothetical protein
MKKFFSLMIFFALSTICFGNIVTSTGKNVGVTTNTYLENSAITYYISANNVPGDTILMFSLYGGGNVINFMGSIGTDSGSLVDTHSHTVNSLAYFGGMTLFVPKGWSFKLDVPGDGDVQLTYFVLGGGALDISTTDY